MNVISHHDFTARADLIRRRQRYGVAHKPFKKAPVWRYPVGVEIRYRIFLQRFVARLQKVTERELFTKLPAIIAEAEREHIMDAWGESLDEALTALEVGFDEVTADDATINFVRSISRSVEEWNIDQFHAMVKKVIGIDHYAYEPWLTSYMKSFVSENIGLINKLTDETKHDIRRIVESGIRKGDSYRSITKDILEGTDLEAGRFAKTKTRARLIARDQIGKFNGELTNIRQQSVGVTEYYWRTAGDERVRPSHDALDGMLCRWDDDTIYSDDEGETWQSRKSIDAFEGRPGEDYQCRCWAEAKFIEPEEEE